VPAGVKAEIVVDLAPFPSHLRAEWDALREHDVLFLLTLQGPDPSLAPLAMRGGKGKGGKGGKREGEEEEVKKFCARYGVRVVRGCEVYEVRDQGGNVLNDPGAAARQQVMDEKDKD
jgi:intron-binding protein aquarius